MPDIKRETAGKKKGGKFSIPLLLKVIALEFSLVGKHKQANLWAGNPYRLQSHLNIKKQGSMEVIVTLTNQTFGLEVGRGHFGHNTLGDFIVQCNNVTLWVTYQAFCLEAIGS